MNERNILESQNILCYDPSYIFRGQDPDPQYLRHAGRSVLRLLRIRGFVDVIAMH